MTIPEGWKLVPEHMTHEMYEAMIRENGVNRQWYAALAVAPTPPAQEDEPVEPIGKMSQYQDQRGRWYDCTDDDLEFYAKRGDKTRVLYMYVDQPVLYTRPDNDKLRKAAKEARVAIEAQEGPIRGDLFTAWKSLCTALEVK